MLCSRWTVVVWFQFWERDKESSTDGESFFSSFVCGAKTWCTGKSDDDGEVFASRTVCFFASVAGTNFVGNPFGSL